MDSPTRASGYDLFKLIVAIFLLILSLFLMWMSPPQAPASPQPTTIPVSPTSISLTATPSSIPSPTATNASEPTARPLPSPTETSVTELTTTPIAGIPVTSACEATASRSHLQIGMKATILRRLNFRSSSGIRDNWLQTNTPGTQVEVVGGPKCVPYSAGTYIWWQIKLPDGRVGWSAEGSLRGSFYFIEPTR